MEGNSCARSDRDGIQLNLDISVEGLQRTEEGPWVSNTGLWGWGGLTWGYSREIWGGKGKRAQLPKTVPERAQQSFRLYRAHAKAPPLPRWAPGRFGSGLTGGSLRPGRVAWTPRAASCPLARRPGKRRLPGKMLARLLLETASL